MMRRAPFPVLLLLAASTFVAAAEGDSTSVPAKTGPRLHASAPAMSWLLRDARLRFDLPRAAEDSAAAKPKLTSATLSFNRLGASPGESLFRPRIYRLTRYESTMKGLGAGARTGLFLGILANALSGSEDYRSAWYAAGAAAAAGAILGATSGANDPGWSVGIDWSIEPRPGDGRME